MTIQNIYFLRHAQALNQSEIAEPYGPQKTVPLSTYGFEMVKNLPTKVLAGNFIKKVDIIYCSPYLRALQTAQGVRSIFPNAPFIVDERLIEFTNHDLIDGQLITKEEKRNYAKKYWDALDIDYRGNEYGETFRESHQTRKSFINYILSSKNNDIICVTHGHTMRRICLLFTGFEKASPNTMLAMRYCQNPQNLDFIHIAHNRDEKQVSMTLRHFNEDYKIIHPFPKKTEDAPPDFPLYLATNYACPHNGFCL